MVTVMKQAFTATLALAVVILGTALSGPARAEVRIDITRGNVEPMPIAISEFFGLSAPETELGKNIADVIQNNLVNSGLFRAIDRAAFNQDSQSLAVRPRFESWRKIDAQALVSGKISTEADGRITVEFRLWDVFAAEHMLGRRYSADAASWRRIAHVVSDAIYKRITGEEGYFDSQIVYVAKSGPKDKRIHKLAIMDQDGANHRYLTDGSSLVVKPRFSPARKEIVYLDFYNNTPRVYLFNLETGRREVLGPYNGMTFSPRFSPDGNRVVMTFEENGNSEIYVMDLRTRQSTRLTKDPAIDTSPSFAPDGNRVTFESDRGGSQQIYVMNADGTDQHRISFGEGVYGTPVWSPRGDLIAFTKILRGEFFIGVMRPDGTGERLLVGGYHNEGPTWSPNGRVLMYYRETRGEKGESYLYSIDLTGYNERLIATPGYAADPAWSPLNR
ncbi:Tol-Pal system protein TolB [Rhodospirillaceae bacterium KN72]|uniref:Tol-Pal system protein TolB n=1 Tax=Pacificispira spongiicola TaxID=2729598 RepID=A0A7Y0HF71_9PROT|nr:Tol-Pal system beta propeller repeat protein TolB [Pacificispira spongiicola]NMM42939.1 Tol-Pal system protein TolB [Pacificispira spongiicola]